MHLNKVTKYFITLFMTECLSIIIIRASTIVNFPTLCQIFVSLVFSFPPLDVLFAEALSIDEMLRCSCSQCVAALSLASSR